MNSIIRSCEAASQISDSSLPRSIRRAAWITKTLFAYTILAFLVLCIAKTAVAGAIPGELPITHSVSGTGASVASIPIPTLPGAGGLEPKLLLSYSSQDGNTGFGLGWSLNGYSTLVRGSKTRDVDGTPGPINFTCDDAYYLDGERIVPVAQLAAGDTTRHWWLKQYGSIPKGAIEYRKWVDDGTTITAILTDVCDPKNPAINGIDKFVAETKSGIRTEYDK
jgi:hypothetical protein